MTKEKLNQIYNELLLRDWNEQKDGSGYLNHYKDFVRKEIGKSDERWKIIRVVNFARIFRIISK